MTQVLSVISGKGGSRENPFNGCFGYSVVENGEKSSFN